MTLLMAVLVVERLVAMEQMAIEQEKVAHNLQVVLPDLFKQVELQGLHFKEDLVPQVAVADTSVVVAEVDIVVVVLTVLVVADHHILVV